MQNERIQFVNYHLRSMEVTATQHHKINEIYLLYRKVWDEENGVLYHQKEASPEAFFLNDTAQCLYVNGELAAFNLARHANLNIQHHLDQRWLKCWPADLIEDIRSTYGLDVIIGNHLTVAEEHRRTSVGESNIAVVFAMLISLLIRESDQTYLGEMRTSRSVQQLGKIAGAVTLKEGHDVYSVNADLVCFPGNGISDTVDQYPDDIKEIYRKAVSYGPRTFAGSDRSQDCRYQAAR